MADAATQAKWDRMARRFDTMASKGAERRWAPRKRALFARMRPGRVLFLALGTGLDIAHFPPGREITAIDISPRMLEQAAPRIAAYDGRITAEVMDIHDARWPDGSFDQVFTSCTFCSVPRPVEGLRALYRLLRPGGELFMFEHTGSRFYPFRPMLDMMSVVSEKLGPALNRPTVDNVRAAGFHIVEVDNLFLDVVKTISAVRPAG